MAKPLQVIIFSWKEVSSMLILLYSCSINDSTFVIAVLYALNNARRGCFNPTRSAVAPAAALSVAVGCRISSGPTI